MPKRHVLNIVRCLVPKPVKKRLADRLPRRMYRALSYSQQGEDLIIDSLLNAVIGDRPRHYVDIGANHPFRISNTALFYAKGGSGVLVEPDPYLAELLRASRGKDTVLQYGISVSADSHADFFQFDANTLNTFSKEEADRYVSLGHRLVDTLRIELKQPNAILDLAGPADLLNVDVEGMDFPLLRAVDWNRHRPVCVCVETCTYELNREPRKLTEIVNFMRNVGYRAYADTFVNTIFVDERMWRMKYPS